MEKQNKLEIESAQNDVKRYAMLEAVERSEGGKVIIRGIEKEVVSAIDKIMSSYKTAQEIELRTWCAILDTRMTMLYLFMRAPKNKMGATEALKNLMKDADVEEEG